MLDLRHDSVGQTSLYWHSAPDTPKTSPENARRQPTPTDTNRRQQTRMDIFKQQLAVSWGVRGCLFVSIGFCWRLAFSGDVLGCLEGVWRCLMVSETQTQWYLWQSEALKCIWRASGFSPLAVQSHIRQTEKIKTGNPLLRDCATCKGRIQKPKGPPARSQAPEGPLDFQ